MLDKQNRRKDIRRFLKWIGTVILSGVVLPIIPIWTNSIIFDRIFNRPEFQARIERVVDNELHKYKVIIKNTGWRSEVGVLGQIRIQFDSKIIFVKHHKLPNGSYFMSEEREEINNCKEKTVCDIRWGEIGSGGETEVEFTVNGPLSTFPVAKYKTISINNWSCNKLTRGLDASCKENELSPK